MRLSFVQLLGCSLVASCNRGPDWETAHKRYLMMIHNGAPRSELCAESKRDAQAALDALDEQEYKGWRIMEKEDCSDPVTGIQP